MVEATFSLVACGWCCTTQRSARCWRWALVGVSSWYLRWQCVYFLKQYVTAIVETSSVRKHVTRRTPPESRLTIAVNNRNGGSTGAHFRCVLATPVGVHWFHYEDVKLTIGSVLKASRRTGTFDQLHVDANLWANAQSRRSSEGTMHAVPIRPTYLYGHAYWTHSNEHRHRQGWVNGRLELHAPERWITRGGSARTITGTYVQGDNREPVMVTRSWLLMQDSQLIFKTNWFDCFCIDNLKNIAY